MNNLIAWLPYICWYFFFLGMLITNTIYGTLTGLSCADSNETPTPHFIIAIFSFVLFIVCGIIGINISHTPGIFGG